MSVFEAIRDHVSLADEARRYTSLERAGSRLRGRCPLHDDSTPSFFVFDDEHFYCFGCRRRGDVVNLRALIGGLSVMEAALELAREHNVPLPDNDPEARRKAEERRQSEAGFFERAKGCHALLSEQPHVAEWWERRGFDEELRERLLLGATPSGTAAAIPFWHRGRVLGFIHRQLEREPKYLLQRAEEFPDGHKPLFVVGSQSQDTHLVEGFIDALALAALDLRGVAVGGTGINEHQKAELLKLKGTIYIFPDADDEGAKAAREWVVTFYPSARLCPAEYGEDRKDVADLFAAEGDGAKTILDGLKSRAVDALDLALSDAPKGSARQRWRYARERVIPLLLRLQDQGERSAAVEDAAKATGLKAADLRAALKPQDSQADGGPDKGAEFVLSDPEPWPEPVNGAALLDDIAATVGRFLSASDHAFRTVALWVVYSHAFDVFDISPLLAIVSPEKRCGKTTLLTLLSALVPRPLAIANITAAALFRTVEKYRPTLLIDEADSFLTHNEELRGILNSGHRKATSYVIRTSGDEHEPRRFTTWTPKAIALIGALPGTLEDRAVLIRLQRKRAQDRTERLRYDCLGEFEHLRRRAARWVSDMSESLRAADPAIPSQITNDRARDNWRPLLAVADAAGASWPELAREVALSLSSVEPETESLKVLLLRDLKALFDERGDRLESEKIVAALTEIEGHPWAEGRNGRPLTKTGLAKLLRPFGVTPRKWRERNLDTVRGYYRSDFDEVFARYLDSETPQTPQATESTICGDSQAPQEGGGVAFVNPDNSNGINDVAFVAVAEGANGGNGHHPLDLSDSFADGDDGLLEADESDEAFAEVMTFFDEVGREAAGLMRITPSDEYGF